WQGHWLAGQSTAPSSGEDVMHICCANYAQLWKPNGNGTFTISGPLSPSPGYGMMDGSWYAADFARDDGRTDLLHSCCGDYANIWKTTTDNTGNFDVNAPTGPGWVTACSVELSKGEPPGCLVR